MMKRFPAGIMATACVPWDEDGTFLEPEFRKQVAHILRDGTKLLYIFGTAGEGYAVSETEFDQVVLSFADEMGKQDAQPMVGVIGLSLNQILERIQRCCDQGIGLFQISLPSWGALGDRELYQFFDSVCGTFPDCQFLHYNLPRAKRIVRGSEYGRLAEAHPNLVATKNCGDSLSHLQGLIEEAPQLQHFLSERGFTFGSMFGECGILASFVMNWSKLRQLQDAGRKRDSQTMANLLSEIQTILRILHETLPGERIDGAYDKLFAKLYDREFPLRLLPPYQGSSDEEFAAFVSELEQKLPAWVPDPW